jgi:helix-turn-helix protein
MPDDVSVELSEYPLEYLDQLMCEKDAAAFLGYTIRALQNWRLRGGGPQFVKVSARSIRYRRRDLMAWVGARLRTSSSDEDGYNI